MSQCCLHRWFDLDKNPLWKYQSLYNPILCLQRLLYPDLYTRLLFLGLPHKDDNTFQRLLVICAKIPAEWRQLANLQEQANEVKYPNDLIIDCKSYNIQPFIERWIWQDALSSLHTTNINILKQQHATTREETRQQIQNLLPLLLLELETPPSQQQHTRAEERDLFLQLSNHYAEKNFEKWKLLVDYESVVH